MPRLWRGGGLEKLNQLRVFVIVFDFVGICLLELLLEICSGLERRGDCSQQLAEIIVKRKRSRDGRQARRDISHRSGRVERGHQNKCLASGDVVKDCGGAGAPAVSHAELVAEIAERDKFGWGEADG